MSHYDSRAGRLPHAATILREAVKLGGRGTRATMEVDPRQAAGLGRLGFRREHEGSSPSGSVYCSIGARGGPRRGLRLDHALCKTHMDPRDAGKRGDAFGVFLWAGEGGPTPCCAPAPACRLFCSPLQ